MKSRAENSLIGSSNSSVRWPMVGDNAFAGTVAQKNGPGDAQLGQCKGRWCSTGSVPALSFS
jgi:hypothetical protein